MSEKIILDENECRIVIYENYLDYKTQVELFEYCKNKPFEFDKPLGGFLGKKGARQRRGVYMESIKELDGYKYSGQIVRSYKMDEKLKIELDNINDKTDSNFDSFFMNYYRDNGEDYIGKHSDDESQMGKNNTVAALTLTNNIECIRIMRFKEKIRNNKIDVKLYPGSLLVMSGKTQENWTHETPKSKKILGTRISLTARKFLN